MLSTIRLSQPYVYRANSINCFVICSFRCFIVNLIEWHKSVSLIRRTCRVNEYYKTVISNLHSQCCISRKFKWLDINLSHHYIISAPEAENSVKLTTGIYTSAGGGFVLILVLVVVIIVLVRKRSDGKKHLIISSQFLFLKYITYKTRFKYFKL